MKKKPVIVPATVRSLQAWYRHVNREAYGGRLPKKVKITFADLVRRRERALAVITRPAYYKEVYRGGKPIRRTPSVPVVIEIERRLRWCWLLATRSLIHEIIHLAKPKLEHGMAFDREALRVGRQCWHPHECML